MRKLPLLAMIYPLILFVEIASGNVKARTPWSNMRVDGVNEYIDPEYLPEGIHLEECHHLHSDVVEAVLKHWIDRKAAGKVPLIFKKVATKFRRHKRTDKQQAVDDPNNYDEVQPERPDDEQTEDEQDPQNGAAGSVPEGGHPDQGSGDAPGRSSAVSGPINMAIEDADFATLQPDQDSEEIADPQNGAAGSVPDEGNPDQGSGDAPGRPSAVSGPIDTVIEGTNFPNPSSMTPPILVLAQRQAQLARKLPKLPVPKRTAQRGAQCGTDNSQRGPWSHSKRLPTNSI